MTTFDANLIVNVTAAPVSFRYTANGTETEVRTINVYFKAHDGALSPYSARGRGKFVNADGRVGARNSSLSYLPWSDIPAGLLAQMTVEAHKTVRQVDPPATV